MLPGRTGFTPGMTSRFLRTQHEEGTKTLGINRRTVRSPCMGLSTGRSCGPGDQPFTPTQSRRAHRVSTAAPGPEQRRGLCSFLGESHQNVCRDPTLVPSEVARAALMHQAEGQGTVAGTGREAPAPVAVGVQGTWGSLSPPHPTSSGQPPLQ